ncbi:hypothetical protein QQF64_028817 [Cirrhinus molitorella]|uniref:Uncharacterized protein n=1 Tax=Cirrhinus molitorella TaxID=172907 RepID=A0ABR3N7Q8_9TELE
MKDNKQDRELSENGFLGLHSLLKKKLCYLRSHISSVRKLYSSVLNCEEFEKIKEDDHLNMDEDQDGLEYDDEEEEEEEEEDEAAVSFKI